ncbi:MAG: hypothetical protein LBL13_10350 [Bacteroidales bacterium]|jgi:hypothetical protein|nr:hypothetical protein [Bacteroidales bacterium]
MKCIHHIIEDAVATCGICGAGLCENCEITSKFRVESKALCKRCNAEKHVKEGEKIIAEYNRHKRRIIWFSILFAPGMFIFIGTSISKEFVIGTIGALLIWGISGIGAAIKEAFTPTPDSEKSVKQQAREVMAEYDAPILSLIFKIIGVFVRFVFTYVLYAVALPFKLGYSITVLQKMKRLKLLDENPL